MDPFLPGTCWDGCSQPYLSSLAHAHSTCSLTPFSLHFATLSRLPPPIPSMGPPSRFAQCRCRSMSLTLNVATAQWSLRSLCRYRSMVATLDRSLSLNVVALSLHSMSFRYAFATLHSIGSNDPPTNRGSPPCSRNYNHVLFSILKI